MQRRRYQRTEPAVEMCDLMEAALPQLLQIGPGPGIIEVVMQCDDVALGRDIAKIDLRKVHTMHRLKGVRGLELGEALRRPDRAHDLD